MKDPQSAVHIPAGGITFVSSTLHCFCIPVLVFLRKDFGYAYLGPKKIFFALIFASGLLAYATYKDQSLRPTFLIPAFFGATSSILYLLHLTIASVKQGQGRAEHDQNYGTSPLLTLISRSKRPNFEELFHMVVEPLLVASLGSFIFSGPFGALMNSCAVALALKETIRWWLTLRLQKRREDSRTDAKELMGDTQSEFPQSPTSAGKTARQRIQRNFPDATR